jgi:hypothetical protein
MPVILGDNSISVGGKVIETVKSSGVYPDPLATGEPSVIFTERMYPPVRNFTAANTTVSGQDYGNGLYEVTYSSAFNTLEPFFCFNTSQNSAGAWADNQYISGVYNGSASIDGGTYKGDWLKIKLPVAIKLSRYSFLQRRPEQFLRDRAPNDFKIYGSNDNSIWDVLVDKRTVTYTNDSYEEIVTNVQKYYTYYALVVNKMSGNQVILNFDEWFIYGVEQLTPVVLNTDYKYYAFLNNGANQESYTVNFPESKICDVLVVAGGGGGGGNIGGGGGSGGVAVIEQISLSGNYTINVGKGGIKNVAAEDGESDGKNSSITNGTNTLTVIGGGGGGHQYGNVEAGNNGGSGGGGCGAGQGNSTGGSSQVGTKMGLFINAVFYGENGGIGARQFTPEGAYFGAAGGGGANPTTGVGGDGLRSGPVLTTTLGGKGGDGIDMSTIFGTNVGQNGYFAGGGGGGQYNANNGDFTLALGGIGGGGNSGYHNTIVAQNGFVNTGGGGGGGSYSSPNGGNGGTGIVLIRYPRTKIPFDAQWTYNTLNANVYHMGNVGIGITNPTFALHVIGNTQSTTYSANSKTFKIEHPLKLNKWLYHGCIEGPRFDNIYRGKKLISEGKAEVDIDIECNTTGGMTPGTFPILNTNSQLFLRNNQTYDRVKGKISGSTISIECENSTDDIEIDWMVVGERHDEHVINTPLTDSDGNLICEHEII